MKITFSPSHLFVSKEILGFEALITKIKNLVDFAMTAVREAQPSGDRPPHHRGEGGGGRGRGQDREEEGGERGKGGGAGAGAGAVPLVPPPPPYPDHILSDSRAFVLQAQDIDFQRASQHVIDQVHKTGCEIAKELQQYLWRTGKVLKREDKEIQNNVKLSLMHLSSALKDLGDEQKRKDIEQRELSKSLSFAKAPTLSLSLIHI